MQGFRAFAAPLLAGQLHEVTDGTIPSDLRCANAWLRNDEARIWRASSTSRE